MSKKEELIKELYEITEHADVNFDEQRLNEIIAELDKIDPIDIGEVDVNEKLREFWEKYGDIV